MEDINENYCWNKYGDIKIITMKNNRYVNAASILNSVSKKKFSSWAKIKSTKELINEISKQNNIPIKDLMISVTTGLNDFRGTYVHPLLVTHIALLRKNLRFFLTCSLKGRQGGFLPNLLLKYALG